MNTSKLQIVSETEKAIKFVVGFKYNENMPTVIFGEEGNQECMTGYLVEVWVPKSIIVDNNIPNWFVQKNILPSFRFKSSLSDKIFF